MPEAQLNLRVPQPLATALRVDAIHRGVRPRDVLVELLTAKYGAAVDETQDGEQAGNRPQPHPAQEQARNGPPASRRPRAAERSSGQHARQSDVENATGPIGAPRTDEPGQTNGAVASSQEPDGVEEEAAAGCPDCAADVVQGKCVDCGWLQ